MTAVASHPVHSYSQTTIKVEQCVQRDVGLSWSKPVFLRDSAIVLVSDARTLVRVSRDRKSIRRFASNVSSASALASHEGYVYVGTTDGRLLQLDSIGELIQEHVIRIGDRIADVAIGTKNIWCVTSRGVIASVSLETASVTTHVASATDRWTTIVASRSSVVAAGFGGHVMRYSIAEDRWISTVLADSNSVFCGTVVDDSVIVLAGDRARVYTSVDAGSSWSGPRQLFRPYPYSTGIDLASPDNVLHACITDDGAWVLTGDFYRSQGVHYTGVYISRDKGVTWQRHALDERISDFFYVYGSPTTCTVWSDTRTAFACTSDLHSGCQMLYSTHDAGATWALDTILSVGGSLLRDTAGAIVDAAVYEWVATQRVGAVDFGYRIRRPVNATVLGDTTDVLLSVDSGRTWTERGRLPFRVRVVTISDGTLYCSGSGGYVRSSVDSGATWQELPGLDSFGSGVEPAGMVVAQNGTIIMTIGGYRFQDPKVPDGSCVVILDPGARSWHASSVSYRTVARTSPSELVVCSSALVTAVADLDPSGSHFNFHVYSSNDNGATWLQRTTSPISTWSSVSVTSDSRHQIIASFSDSARTPERQSLPRILFSQDNGSTWTTRAVIEPDSASLALLGINGIVWISMNTNGTTLMNDGAKLWLLPRLGADWQIVPLPNEGFENGRLFSRPNDVDGSWYVPASRNSIYRVSSTSTTGLAILPDMNSQGGHLVWPNPASGSVSLECEGSERVGVYSLEGRLVLDLVSGTDGVYAFSTQELPVGTYVLVTSRGRHALLQVVR
ncbi:MAG: exo-alpha-sialidase [Bacteroidetes bacterium]|nr:exo-alpha-sialidase [Bacteroidota bacterium]